MPSFSNIALRSTIGFAILIAALSAHGGINLTPAVSEYTAEGIKFQQLTFRDEKERIEYEVPQGWTFDGNSAALRLKPATKYFAEAVIQAAPLSTAQSLDENVRIGLKEKALADLPTGSQLAKIVQETESPLLLSGQPTLELIISYQLIGEKFSRSILFVNRANAQWSFQFTAKTSDFEPFKREFSRSILSWRWFVTEGAPAQSTTTQASAH